MRLFNRIANSIITRTRKRAPDITIGEPDAPYLMRWWLIPRNRFFNLYLHHFCQSDDDRALHDHPWINCSILLRGSYIEHTKIGPPAKRCPGTIVMREAGAAHRIELLSIGGAPLPAWSLFITGPVVRSWGFHCPKGWRHWKDFTSFREVGEGGRGRIGKGCD